jgi:hypothetical protein
MRLKTYQILLQVGTGVDFDPGALKVNFQFLSSDLSNFSQIARKKSITKAKESEAVVFRLIFRFN